MNKQCIQSSKKTKKMFIGGLITTGIGLASTAINNDKQKEEELKLKKLQFKNTLDARNASDQVILDKYPSSGYDTNELYAKGGTLGTNKIPDSNSQELAAGVEKVVNAGTHESGNDVDVSDSAGDVKAKVEDQEVILDGDKVLSERLGYADVAEGISSAKGDIEKVLQGDNLKRLHNRDKATFEHTMSPLKRTLAKLDAANEANFKAQEQNKGGIPAPNESGVPEAAYGARITEDGVLAKGRIGTPGVDTIALEEGTLATSTFGAKDQGAINADKLRRSESLDKAGNLISSLADNAVGLLQRTPKVPKPIIQEAAKLNTKVDISGDLQDIKDQEREGSLEIDQNTSNSNVALARKASLRNTARRAKSSVRSGARKEELGLENVDSLNRQRVTNANASAQNEYAQNVMTRDVFKNEKLLKNVINVGQDVRQFNVDKASKERDDRAIAATLAQNSGGSDYNIAVNGGLDNLSADMKAAKIKAYEALGRDTTYLKAHWKL